MTVDFVLAIHGGAGTPAPELTTPAIEAAMHVALRTALLAGHAVLSRGGCALDAVQSAVAAMEDDALFNAGLGAVFNADGEQEMDAAIMAGHTGRAGAVAGVCGPRNPVRAARAVLDHSGHVLLIGQGAHKFLQREGVAFERPEYFQTERRWRALQDRLAAHRSGRLAPMDDSDRHGTVGAVALDRQGNLAAATSTGGMTGKLPGRVGDTPIIGAGTWASKVCAVSCTGDGEHFINTGAARDLDARIEYGHETLEVAAQSALAAVGRSGGSGGLVAVDASGQVAMPFNSRGMHRGSIRGDGHGQTAIYREPLRRTDRTSECL